MNIRLVATDLAHRKVTLHCQNSGRRGDIDFYTHVLFKDNEINFDAEYIYNHQQIEISKIIETEKDFIEDTAKMCLQDALEKYLEDTSTTMFLYKEDGNKQRMYVLNPMQELQVDLKKLLIDWYKDKWYVADIEWFAIEYYESCYIRSTVVMLNKEDCSIPEGSRILTNSGLGEVREVKFL